MSKSKSKERATESAPQKPEPAVDALALEKKPEGVILPVKAQPGAGRNELRGLQDGALKVCVTQIAEKGKANKAIVEFLAKALKLKKSQLQLVAGELASQKKFLITEIAEEELREKVMAAI